MEITPINIHLNSDDDSEGEDPVKFKSRKRILASKQHTNKGRRVNYDDDDVSSEGQTPRSCASEVSEDEALMLNPPWRNNWYTYDTAVSEDGLSQNPYDINNNYSEYGNILRSYAPNTQEDGTLFSDVPSIYLTHDTSEYSRMFHHNSYQDRSEYGNINQAASEYGNISEYDNINQATSEYGNINQSVSEYGNISEYDNINHAASEYGNISEYGSLCQDTSEYGNKLNEDTSEYGNMFHHGTPAEKWSTNTENPTEVVTSSEFLFRAPHEEDTRDSNEYVTLPATPARLKDHQPLTPLSSPFVPQSYIQMFDHIEVLDSQNAPQVLANDVQVVGGVDTEKLDQSIFPAVHISEAGLISVLLSQDLVVEMTIDQTMRIVDHTNKTVVAFNNRGDMSCLNHTAARLYNQGVKVEGEIFWNRRVEMDRDGITFSPDESKKSYHLHPEGKLEVVEHNFSDLSNDTSVTLLFATSKYGPDMIPKLEDVAKEATYNFHADGSVSVLINNVKIDHKANNDVFVEHETKSMHISQCSHTAHVDTDVCELSVERDCKVQMRKSSFNLIAGYNEMVMSDSVWECGVDNKGEAFVRPSYYTKQTIIIDGESVDFTEVGHKQDRIMYGTCGMPLLNPGHPLPPLPLDVDISMPPPPLPLPPNVDLSLPPPPPQLQPPPPFLRPPCHMRLPRPLLPPRRPPHSPLNGRYCFRRPPPQFLHARFHHRHMPPTMQNENLKPNNGVRNKAAIWNIREAFKKAWETDEQYHKRLAKYRFGAEKRNKISESLTEHKASGDNLASDCSVLTENRTNITGSLDYKAALCK